MGKAWHSFRRFIASRRGQTVFNILYSWGAAVVILGAMFKIMHVPAGNMVLMIGMIVEVIVFIAAGFDYSSPSSDEVGANALSGVIVSGGVGYDESPSNIKLAEARKSGDSIKSSGVSGSSVVVLGGSGGNGVTAVSGSGSSSSSSTGQPSAARTGSADYGQSAANTAQNLEEFSTTINSLNEASQKLLKAYNQITETNGFVDNLTTLNQNVSGLNDVFNAQLQTITEQMSAIRYINDSLARMKNLYDGAIGDSYMFREESAKMTKHIEALNNVYARLLQAMTTNNNPNQPKF